MDYMVYAYLQQGRDTEARAVVRRAVQNPDRFYGGLLGYNFTAMPARYALERNAWADAAALRVPVNALPFVEAVTRFARAIGAARSGQPDAARADIATLATLEATLRERNDAYWATVVTINIAQLTPIAGEVVGAMLRGGLEIGASIGPYRIVRALGTGGMGAVYLARDPRINRPIALKVIPIEKEFEDEELEALEPRDELRLVEVVGDLAAGEVAELVGVREVVDRDDLGHAVAVERLDELRADESCRSGDDVVHQPFPNRSL